MSAYKFPALPVETVQEARRTKDIRAAYLAIGDQLESLMGGEDLKVLDRNGGMPDYNIALQALVTVFQFTEDLPDSLAAEALCTRLDWKYALHLPLKYPGMKEKALCEFRQGLLGSSTALKVFQGLLERLASTGLLESPEEPPEMDGSKVVQTVCNLTRLERIETAMSQALEALAAQHPEWLLEIARPHWYRRYQNSQENLHLPSSEAEQVALAQAIGTDAHFLLTTAHGMGSPALNGLAEIRELSEVWYQQYILKAGAVCWRTPEAGCSYCLWNWVG